MFSMHCAYLKLIKGREVGGVGGMGGVDVKIIKREKKIVVVSVYYVFHS